MKKGIVLIFGILLFGCNHENSYLLLDDAIYFKNATIITANQHGDIINKQSHLIVQSDSIVYVGEKAPQIKGKYITIDVKGKYIMPGLIDSHVHLANVPGLNFKQKQKYPELIKAYYEQLPKSFLYYGFTTLIDLNNYAPDIVNNINESNLKPDIYTCGQQVQVMNDFMMEMEELPKRVRYQSPFLYDSYNENIKFPDSIDLKLHTPRKVIENLGKENAICVKTLYEDETSGFKKFWESPTKHIMTELITEAHNESLPVILHTTSFEGQSFAESVDVDIIAHGMWNWTTNPRELEYTKLPKAHQDLLKSISNKKIGYQPTFRTLFAEDDVLTESLLKDEEIKNVLPKIFIDWLHTEESQWIKRKLLNRINFIKKVNPEFYNQARMNFENDEEMRQRLTISVKKRLEIITKFLSDNDANLLFGSDGVAMNMYTNPPGYNGFLELTHWNEAGVSLETIFKAVTINNAKAFNLHNEIGSIEKGKKANILILNKSPLQDINAYNSIETIIINGKLINRDVLSAQNE
ncbi:amidohydrolase family protein [uncultured Psychroserpens sp.]|uniref:amidohydrolase family protein n=1 Tax=uncultured Psychroserpens sp. TaxID=255436 RepID=UPI002612C3E4|nr:amidohydrolase family protein [uncultured Psychroserpens sp.]